MDQVQALVQQGPRARELVLDVRDPDEYADSHVPGSKNIPLGLILDSPTRWVRELRDYNTVYVHCGGGGRAGKASHALESAGLTNIVHVCDSGMRSWLASGYPIERTP